MLTKVIEKIKYLAETEKRKLGMKSVLAKLESAQDENIKVFTSVIKFLKLNDSWSKEELEALRGVDQIRESYIASTDTITRIDYGSGNSTSERSDEQKFAGVAVEDSISELCQSASSPQKWGELIFKLIREFKPNNCLELGTCLGISAAYQISALKLNGKGVFNTIDGAEVLARYADESLKKLNYKDYKVNVGRFVDVLPNLLSKDNLLDFVFIDGHHDKEATIDYFERIYPYLNDKAIVIFDDVNWSKGMKDAWGNIYNGGQGIYASFDLFKWGICIIDKNRDIAEKAYYKLSY